MMCLCNLEYIVLALKKFPKCFDNVYIRGHLTNIVLCTEVSCSDLESSVFVRGKTRCKIPL